MHLGPHTDLSERPTLLIAAQAALRGTDTALAQLFSERAVQMVDAADAELGTVPALMLTIE